MGWVKQQAQQRLKNHGFLPVDRNTFVIPA
jgi:hypothetical protein